MTIRFLDEEKMKAASTYKPEVNNEVDYYNVGVRHNAHMDNIIEAVQESRERVAKGVWDEEREFERHQTEIIEGIYANACWMALFQYENRTQKGVLWDAINAYESSSVYLCGIMGSDGYDALEVAEAKKMLLVATNRLNTLLMNYRHTNPDSPLFKED